MVCMLPHRPALASDLLIEDRAAEAGSHLGHAYSPPSGIAIIMATIFLDCLDDMTALWQSVLTEGDPPVTVNIGPGQSDDVPGLLAGYSTCIVDHTYFDAALLERCTDLRRIVFLGTGASSFIDLAAA